MATKIFLPRLGESVEEASIGQWMKQVGDEVKRGDVIAELETAKAMMELESPVKGVLLAIFPEIGETIQMGELVAIVGKADEDWQGELDEEEETVKLERSEKKPATKPATKQEPSKRLRISPNAKRVAKELGIALGALEPKASGERITVEDVRHFAASRNSRAAEEKSMKKIIPTPVEKITAQRMVESARTIPQFSISMAVNAESALEMVKKNSAESGRRITLTALLVQIAAQALKNHPRVNAKHGPDAIYAFQEVHVAVAVSTLHGLFVPVIHHADSLSIEDIGERLAVLRERCENKSLQVTDTEGATFTISNLGMKRVHQFVPIIDPSQAAILGVGTVEDRVAVRKDGSFAPTKEMILTLTCDHRVLDGAAAADFLLEMKTYIEQSE